VVTAAVQTRRVPVVPLLFMVILSATPVVRAMSRHLKRYAGGLCGAVMIDCATGRKVGQPSRAERPGECRTTATHSSSPLPPGVLGRRHGSARRRCHRIQRLSWRTR
jgi:hypothetical protein